jgi:hypothetical protein
MDSRGLTARRRFLENEMPNQKQQYRIGKLSPKKRPVVAGEQSLKIKPYWTEHNPNKLS